MGAVFAANSDVERTRPTSLETMCDPATIDVLARLGVRRVLSRTYRFPLNGSTVPPGQPLLGISGVGLRFGDIQALDNVGLTVVAGSVHAVIGPNGAGKSSLPNCVSGLYRPHCGQIRLNRDGGTVDLLGRRPHQIARLGVARSFQNIELFKHLTVLENLMLGRHTRMSTALLWFGPARRQEIAHREYVEEVIDLLELQVVRNKPVGTLAYGYAKRVEFGRALCLQPAVLLLDEPMAGMNAEEREYMARYILDVNELRGVTVVLIEHDMDVVMDISHRVTVLDFGKLIADGSPDEVRGNPAVVEAYLGEQS
ncbi:MAG: ABC transporter ATP-binding protein [Pseudonocardiaceae bacterium]